jgi:hypothetical protein
MSVLKNCQNNSRNKNIDTITIGYAYLIATKIFGTAIA